MKKIRQLKKKAKFPFHTNHMLVKKIDSFLTKNTKQNQKLLDIGVGRGIHSKLALSHKLNVFGIDISQPDNLDLNIHFKKLDLNKDSLPFSNEFDIVLCTEIIEHIENPHKLFREINKVLKKGGLCLLSTPNLHSYYEKVYYMLYGHFRRFPEDAQLHDHINPLNLVEIRLLSKFYGLKIGEIYTEGLWVPILRTYLNEKFRSFFKLGLGESLIIILKKE